MSKTLGCGNTPILRALQFVFLIFTAIMKLYFMTRLNIPLDVPFLFLQMEQICFHTGASAVPFAPDFEFYLVSFYTLTLL